MTEQTSTETTAEAPSENLRESARLPGEGSADNPSPAVPTAAEKAKARQAALDEAAKLLGVDCRNSIDQLVSACINNNPQNIEYHWDLLQKRIRAADEQLATAHQNL